MKNKRHIIILSTATFLLLIPLIAMQFTDEVKWNLLDFIIAASLLVSTGLTFDLIIRKVNKPKIRIVLFVSILLMFLLIWAELAVGILGTSFSGH